MLRPLEGFWVVDTPFKAQGICVTYFHIEQPWSVYEFRVILRTEIYYNCKQH